MLHTSMTGGCFYVLKKFFQIFLKIRNNFVFSCRGIYGEVKLSAAEPEMGTGFATQLNTTRPRDTEYRAKVCKDSGESRAEGKGGFIQESLCEDRRANSTDSENAVVAVMRISDNGSGAGTTWNGTCDRAEGDLKLSLQ